MDQKLKTFDVSELITCQGIKGEIGCGTFAKVIFCKTSNSKKFAVKCFTLSGTWEKMKLKEERSKAEAEILHKVAHPNIMKVFGTVTWKNYFGVVTEYLSGGNLDELLSNKETDIPWPLRLRMAYQLSEAITYLHNYKSGKSFIHGDIKPENILLTHELDLKLSDFGSINLARCTGASTTKTKLISTHQHTPYYTPPEYLKDILKDPSTKKDVFSFGVVLYELLSRKRPYENATAHPDTIINVIISRGQRPDQKCFEEIKTRLSEDDLSIFNLLQDYMEQCWSQSPDDRPEMKTVSDVFASGLNKIEEEYVKGHARILVEKLKKTEKDFDISEGISLKSHHSDGSHNYEDVNEYSDAKTPSYFPSHPSKSGYTGSVLGPAMLGIHTSTPKTTAAPSSAITPADEKLIVKRKISSSSDKPSTSGASSKKNCLSNNQDKSLEDQPFTSQKHIEGSPVDLDTIRKPAITSHDNTSLTALDEATELFPNQNIQEAIYARTHSINQFLDIHQYENASKECEKLIKIPVEKVTFGFSLIVNEVDKMIPKLTEAFLLVTATQTIQWCLDLFLKFDKTNDTLTPLAKFIVLLNNVDTLMFEKEEFVNIARYALPLHLKLHAIIERVEVVTLKNKSIVRAWNLFYIACCNIYIREFTIALGKFQSVIDEMISSYGVDANKNRLYAMCFEHMTLVAICQSNKPDAKKYCQQALEFFQIAEDMSQDEIKEKIASLNETMSKYQI